MWVFVMVWSGVEEVEFGAGRPSCRVEACPICSGDRVSLWDDDMKAALVMFKADGSRREFALPAGATVVGRKNSCGLRIPLTSVSRQHCEFRVEGAGVTLRDLGSSNGTYRNGERVQEAGLSAGDTVVVGPVQFTLTVDGQPPDIKPARPALESVGAGAAGAVGGAAVAALPPSMDVADAASSQADMSLSDDLELDIPDAAPALGDEDQAGGSGGGVELAGGDDEDDELAKAMASMGDDPDGSSGIAFDFDDDDDEDNDLPAIEFLGTDDD